MNKVIARRQVVIIIRTDIYFFLYLPNLVAMEKNGLVLKRNK